MAGVDISVRFDPEPLSARETSTLMVLVVMYRQLLATPIISSGREPTAAEWRRICEDIVGVMGAAFSDVRFFVHVGPTLDE